MLNVLVIDPDSKRPLLPQHIIKKWQSHDRFGPKMREKADAIVEESGDAVLDEACNQLPPDGTPRTPQKRTSPEQGGSSAK